MAFRLNADLTAMSGAELDAVLYHDFAAFVQVMFQVVYPGRSLVWTPYLGLLCSYLEDVAHGRRTRVIINIPPRFLKSFIVSVAFPAYLLGYYPDKEIMNVSYSQDLAKDFGRQTLAIMTSPIFRRIFGEILPRKRQPLAELRTRANGVRRATSIDGTATGQGADVLTFDDPQKAGETLSDAVRRATNAAYEQTFFSRGNSPRDKRIVIVMQRLHEDDFVGHVLGLGEDWDVINLPAIAEEDQAIAFSNIFGPQTYRRAVGESLHPERVSLEDWAKIRRTMGEAIWSTQYQQRPTPAGGGLVETAWFIRYEDAETPKFERIVQSWDTANTDGVASDWSVCTTWGVAGKHVYLLHVFRKRLKFPELRRAVIEQAQLHDADTVWIEDHASGTQLVQQLRSDNFGRVRGIKPTRDKRSRMETQTALIENGFVHVPKAAPWLAEYLHELAMFPNGKFDDQVDSTSQALLQLNNRDSFERMREFFEDIDGRGQAEEEIWVMQPPPGLTHAYDITSKEHRVDPDGYFHMKRSFALCYINSIGWSRVR